MPEIHEQIESIFYDAPVGTPYVDNNLVLWVASGYGRGYRLDHLLLRVRDDEDHNTAWMGDYEMLEAYLEWVEDNDPPKNT